MLKSGQKKFLNKNGCLAIISFCFLFLIIIFYFYYRSRKLTLNFFDVGQGDSALITTPGGLVILIDGGPDNTILRRLGDSLPFYRRRIDLIIFSHYHDDHITGLVEVLKRYQIKQIIYASGVFESPVLETLLRVAQEQKIKLSSIVSTSQLNLGTDCLLNFLNPRFLGVKEDQNNSLVVKLACVGKNFLFTGDNSAAVEKALISFHWDLKALVFKAAHHASNSANSEEFLRAVNPQLIIISVGVDNRFGHPSPIILARLTELGIKFKRTDQSGSLKIITP
ncbi:MAG: MBL fold metallo-hydrolase [Patescibacteria group bacterium]|jgi:competence protein ComEC